MKTESDSPQPTAQTQPVAQPVTYSTAQWPQGYTYYPQASYTAHYQAYAPPPTMAQSQTPSQSARQTGQSSSGGVDTSDIATLNDALGSAGVDLRAVAEEERLQRSHEQHHIYRSYEDRTRKQPVKPSFDTSFLGTTMRSIGTKHKVTKIPDDSINYMALALRIRLQELITAMIVASHHRTDTQFDRPASLYEDGKPMWSLLVRSDVAKQLAALEKVEREEELKIRRERKERADMAAAHAAALAAQTSGGTNGLSVEGMDDEGGGAKKKRKKEGPGVTARNMSEDVRKKMSNAVASQAAGLGSKYAWMTAASSTVAPPLKPKPVTNSPNPGATTTTTPATTTTPTTTGSSWARPYVPTKKSTAPTQPIEEDTRTVINMRDALFVIEKERGHGGGRGAARIYI